MGKFKELVTNINWSEVKPKIVVSMILQILAWVNMGLTAIGKPVINVHEDLINQIVSWVFVFGTAAYGTWKNHSFTWFAQTGDKIAHALRDGKLTMDEVDEIMQKIGDKDVTVKVDEDLFNKEIENAAQGKESDDIEG